MVGLWILTKLVRSGGLDLDVFDYVCSCTLFECPISKKEMMRLKPYCGLAILINNSKKKSASDL
jgi:hypothetical protein